MFLAVALGGGLIACHSESPKSPGQASEPSALAPELFIGPELLTFQGETLTLPADSRLSALKELTLVLSELSSKEQGLRIRLAPGVNAANLLRVLLSAQEAGVMPILLEGERMSLELLLPDSEQTPGLAAFDVFAGVEAQSIYLSRSLSDLGAESPAAPSAPTGEGQELESLLQQTCRKGACGLVAVSMNADFPLQRLEPFLSALTEATGGKARLRLLVAGVPQAAQPAAAPQNSEFSKSAFSLIEKNRERFKRCQRLADPGAFTRGGTVMIRFVVTPLGLVFEAEAMPEESTVVDARVGRCVVETVSRLKFEPPQSGNEELRYLLRF